MNVINRDKTIKGMYPRTDGVFLTPSDTEETPLGYREGLYVIDGTGNTVKVTFLDGSIHTFSAAELENNDTANISVKLVWATGTTATQIKCIKRTL